jgi:Transposase domain (DUF772)
MMIIHATKPLFAWDCLEDSPSLQTIEDLLATLPDGKLLNSLRAARGKGRDDYPVSVLWGVVVLRIALRRISTEAVLAELRRNGGLRRLIGIESEAGEPKPWNISRFEDVLGQEPRERPGRGEIPTGRQMTRRATSAAQNVNDCMRDQNDNATASKHLGCQTTW